MSWIESHDTLARHPKTRRLVRLLNISTPQAIGHLHLLWWWALEYAEQGDLTAYDDADIADAAMWEGETAIFVGALRTAGFINPDNTIHDWQDYAGKLLAQRKASAERQAAFRNGHKVPQTVPLQPPNTTSNNSHADVIPTDAPRNAPVTVTSHSRNVLTVPITVPDQDYGERERERADTQAREEFDAIPGATNHALLDRPAQSFAKPSRDEATVAAFTDVMAAYPCKRGIPPNYDTGLAAFIGVPLDERANVLVGARNYADSDEVSREIVMGLDRFIRDNHYRRWQRPEAAAHLAPAKNGAPHAATKSTATERQYDNLTAIAAARAARHGRPDPDGRNRGSPAHYSRLLSPADPRRGDVGDEVDCVG